MTVGPNCWPHRHVPDDSLNESIGVESNPLNHATGNSLQDSLSPSGWDGAHVDVEDIYIWTPGNTPDFTTHDGTPQPRPRPSYKGMLAEIEKLPPEKALQYKEAYIALLHYADPKEIDQFMSSIEKDTDEDDHEKKDNQARTSPGRVTHRGTPWDGLRDLESEVTAQRTRLCFLSCQCLMAK